MGCGKSSVGRRLSELLCCPFMDLDQVIEERTGRTIPEIFSQDGEPAFRQMELNALKQVISEGWSKTKSLPLRGPCRRAKALLLRHECPLDILCRPSRPFTRPRAAMVLDSPLTDQHHTFQLVLALGGGAVMTPECAEIVRSETKCIYLRASIDTLIEHLEGQTDNRPLLPQEATVLRDRITDLMAKRASIYEKTAHVIIDIDGKSIEAVASEIISILG